MAAAAFISETRATPLGVRINSFDSAWADDDVDIALGADFIMTPKASSQAQIASLATRVVGRRLWPLIETPEGIMRAWEIAATPNVAGVLFGAFDYAASVGCALSWDALLYARSKTAAACARAHVEVLDSPPANLHNIAEITQSTLRAKALGFTGRACIHPAQVTAVNAAYSPSEEEITRAQRVLEAFEAANGGAAQLDGELIEQPVALAARRILARARS